MPSKADGYKLDTFVARHLRPEPRPVYVAPWGHKWLVTPKRLEGARLVGHYTQTVAIDDLCDDVEYARLVR